MHEEYAPCKRCGKRKPVNAQCNATAECVIAEEEAARAFHEFLTHKWDTPIFDQLREELHSNISPYPPPPYFDGIPAGMAW